MILQKTTKYVTIPPQYILNNKKLIGSKCLNQVLHVKVIYRILNPTNEHISFKPNTVLAKAFIITEKPVFSLDHEIKKTGQNT